MSNEFRKKLITTILVTSFFSFTLLLFQPINLYFTNITEYPFFLSDVWYGFVLLTIALIILMTALLVPLKFSVNKIAVALLFTLALLFWLQGNILAWNYGVLDGKEINWAKYSTYGYIDTTIWLVLILVTLLKRDFVYKIIKPVSIILILTQLVSIFVIGFQAPKQPEWKKYDVDETYKFTYSKQKNVIILVLDTFQSDIFQEIITEDPKYKSAFQGFTYFRNATGGFNTTYPSVPLILTGQYYNNFQPYQSYIKKAYSSTSIPKILKQNGYRVDLFAPGLELVYCNQEILSNLKAKNIMDNHGLGILKNVYKVSFFNNVPQYFKKYLIRTGNDNTDLEFMNSMISESKIGNEKYMFKYYHIGGAHPPFQLNERLERKMLEFNRSNYKTQAKAALEITEMFLNKLKAMGVYSNSMIFVVGDHGLGTYNVNLQAGNFKENTKIIKQTPPNVIASGTPLFLVKPFSSNDDMKISDAPVSLADIPKTIVSQLNFKGDLPGQSVFSVKETDQRQRRFLFYTWGHEYWNQEYLSDMNEYIVSGHSWLSESWNPSYRKYTRQGIKSTLPSILKDGSQIKFGKGGNAERYQGQGWGQPEDGFTWTDGKNASLIVPVGQPRNDLILNCRLSPLIAGSINKQRVNIYVNGKKLEQWTIKDTGDYKITVPKNEIHNSLLELYFEFPDAASPLELKLNKDSRVLGISVQYITFSEKP